MNAGATLANVLWLAKSSGAASRFAAALRDPRGAQTRWLATQLARHAPSDFGRRHDFAALASPAAFARRVPLSEYRDVAPSIARIRSGEGDVLACGRVTHLAPTSGSTGARKLIPFTASLQDGFRVAVSSWMIDLARQRPAMTGGPGYWSVSPLADNEDDAPTATPVGFADDADYLGGASAWLVRQAQAAPAALRHVREPADFWSLLLLALLRQRDLRLISIWHPSFFQVLVGAAEGCWPALLEAIATGACPWVQALPVEARAAWRIAPDPARADELRRLGAGRWVEWWPRLQILSCWGEQAAEAGWARLRQQLPNVLVQAKGLLATEAVVTIPLGNEKPLAVTSHFFEFIDDRGELLLAHELSRGAHYEVVVTNGGGLWRYRLGDMVECTGFVHRTPSLRFLGRNGRVSDLRGEKLSETFVGEALRSLWSDQPLPAYVALRASEHEGLAGYELLVSVDATSTSVTPLADRLEEVLRTNPNYALARRLGQLNALRVIPVELTHGADELNAQHGRMGDSKPQLLLRLGDASP